VTGSIFSESPAASPLSPKVREIPAGPGRPFEDRRPRRRESPLTEAELGPKRREPPPSRARAGVSRLGELANQATSGRKRAL